MNETTDAYLPRYNDFFPALNAGLNSAAAILLCLGFAFIKLRKPEWHRFSMLSAFVVSTGFLASYLYYHFNFDARRFPGEGVLRNLYLAMLLSHIVGAVILVPGVVGTLYHALKKNWAKHKAWTRWVFPLWLYISVTGVAIYFSLYGASSS